MYTFAHILVIIGLALAVIALAQMSYAQHKLLKGLEASIKRQEDHLRSNHR